MNLIKKIKLSVVTTTLLLGFSNNALASINDVELPVNVHTAKGGVRINVVRDSGVEKGFIITDNLSDYGEIQYTYFYNMSGSLVGTDEPFTDGAVGGTGNSYEFGSYTDTNGNIAISFESDGEAKDKLGFYSINTSTGELIANFVEKDAVGTSSNKNGSSQVTILSNGNVVLYYQGDGMNKAELDIYSSTGTEINTKVLVDAKNPQYNNSLGIQPLDSGGFIAMWDNDITLGMQRFDNSGNTVGNKFYVSMLREYKQDAITVDILSDGSLAIQLNYGEVHRLDLSGDTPTLISSVDTRVSGAKVHYLSAFSNGGYVIVFEDSNGEPLYRIYDNYGNPSSSTASSLSSRTNNGGGNDATTSVDTFENGSFVAVWGEYHDINHNKSYFSIIDNIPPIIELDADNSSLVTGAGFGITLNGDVGGVIITDSDVVVSDANGENIKSITVTLTNRQEGAEGATEYLTLSSATNITINGSGRDTITLTDSGSATKQNFMDAIKAMRYENTASTNATARIITFLVTDDTDLTSNTATTTVAITLNSPSTATDTPPTAQCQ